MGLYSLGLPFPFSKQGHQLIFHCSRLEFLELGYASGVKPTFLKGFSITPVRESISRSPTSIGVFSKNWSARDHDSDGGAPSQDEWKLSFNTSPSQWPLLHFTKVLYLHYLPQIFLNCQGDQKREPIKCWCGRGNVSSIWDSFCKSDNLIFKYQEPYGQKKYKTLGLTLYTFFVTESITEWSVRHF